MPGQEDLLRKSTRRWGTTRYRPSPTKTTTTRDPQRRSSSLLPPCYELRMDTLQGAHVQVPPRDLVELPRTVSGVPNHRTTRGDNSTSTGSPPLQSRAEWTMRNHSTTTSSTSLGPMREHHLASAIASGELLLPNWLSGHHVLEPIFGLILHSKFKNRLLSTLFIGQTLTNGCVCAYKHMARTMSIRLLCYLRVFYDNPSLANWG